MAVCRTWAFSISMDIMVRVQIARKFTAGAFMTKYEPGREDYNNSPA